MPDTCAQSTQATLVRPCGVHTRVVPLLILRVAAVLLSLSTLYAGCTTTSPTQAPAPAADSTLPPDQLKADLTRLREVVQTVHPLFVGSSARTDSFHRRVHRLRTELHRPQTPCEFYQRAASVIASLDDGHTAVGVPSRCMDAYVETNAVFPFDLAFHDDRALVLHSYGETNPVPPGTRILSIDGHPLPAMLDRFLELVPGARRAFRRRRLEGATDTFKFYLWQVCGITAPFSATLAVNGKPHQRTIPGVHADTIRASRASRAETDTEYSYRPLGEDTGLLTLRSFGIPEDGYEDFLDSTFQAIHQTRRDHLIIDVRDNRGGQSGRAEDLLRYLVSAPFSLTDSVRIRASEPFRARMKRRIPKGLRWLPVQYLDGRGRTIWQSKTGSMVSLPGERIEPRPPDRRFRGDVTVLVNEGTYSTAVLFAAAIKRLDVGQLVGRETGGPVPSMFGQPIRMRLPNSGLWMWVSTMQFEFQTPSAGPSSHGVEPAVRVPRDVAKTIGGSDPILQRAESRHREP